MRYGIILIAAAAVPAFLVAWPAVRGVRAEDRAMTGESIQGEGRRQGVEATDSAQEKKAGGAEGAGSSGASAAGRPEGAASQGEDAARATEKAGLRDEGGARGLETATFGARCFWGVEAAFRKVEGVAGTEVGYSGGDFENPTYEDVCSGRTGHAEVVRVRFDPERVTYEELLEVFWNAHNPTQVNRQGPDVGYQYRSVILFHTEEQERLARASKKALEESRKYSRPVATSVEPAGKFWRAEEYHQQYLEKRGLAACHVDLR